MIPWLAEHDPFPPVEAALSYPNGLLAAGGDLSTPRLLAAYRNGIFPWYSEGEPILWWSPDPRMVLYPAELKVSRSLRKTLAKGAFELRVDHAFRQVMLACAQPRRDSGGTWISKQMVEAYEQLHQLGYAHSVESWAAGELVGGLYGVAIGKVFFGESMFARRSDASKVALVHLIGQLRRWKFGIVDCQMSTEHLASLGAREIPRRRFCAALKELVNSDGHVGRWHFDHVSLDASTA